MKYSVIIPLLCMVFISTSCDDELSHDFRDAFVTEYQCSYALKTLTVFSTDYVSFTDTIYYSTDTLINISKYGPDNEMSFLDWNMLININGEIDSIYCNHENCMECEYFPFELGTTNLIFETISGGKTTWYNYKIIGVKQ